MSIFYERGLKRAYANYVLRLPKEKAREEIYTLLNMLAADEVDDFISFIKLNLNWQPKPKYNSQDLQKEGVILASEGPILTLYKNPRQEFVLKSGLKNTNGYIYFTTDQNDLIDYFNSKMSLQDLYNWSDDIYILFEGTEGDKTFLHADFKEPLAFGNKHYNELRQDLKSKEMEMSFLKP